MSTEFLQDIQNTAEQVRSNSDVLVVIGIGGSYLGSKAVIEALATNMLVVLLLQNQMRVPM